MGHYSRLLEHSDNSTEVETLIPTLENEVVTMPGNQIGDEHEPCPICDSVHGRLDPATGTLLCICCRPAVYEDDSFGTLVVIVDGIIRDHDEWLEQ